MNKKKLKTINKYIDLVVLTPLLILSNINIIDQYLFDVSAIIYIIIKLLLMWKLKNDVPEKVAVCYLLISVIYAVCLIYTIFRFGN